MSKPWYKSKTIYALAVAAVAQILVFLGAGEPEAGELAGGLVEALAPIVGLIATGAAVAGRKVAKGPLTARETASQRTAGARSRSHPLAAIGAVAFACALVACSGLGLEAPQNFNERLAYAYTTHTAVLDATSAALEAEEISSNEAAELAELADDARQLLDSARNVYDAGREAEAQRQLTLALAILSEMQRYSEEE